MMDGNYLTIPVRLNCADCNQVFYFYTRTAYELHISAHDWCRAKQTRKRQPPVALPGSSQDEGQSELRQLTPPAAGRFASSLPQPVAGQVTQSRPMNDIGDLPDTELRLGPPAGRFMNRVPQPVIAGPVIRSSWPMKNEGGGRRYHPYGNCMSKEEEAYRQRCTRDFLHDWPILLGNSSNRRDRNGNKTFENRRSGEENVDLSVFRSTRASDDQEDSTVDLELKLGL